MKRVVLHTGTTSEVKASTRDNHLFVPLADLHARDLKLAELARALPHEDGCASFFCSVCAWYCVTAHTPDDTDPTFHAAVPKACNCPRGELLAALGETNNG
jgi:hypothetical protein